MNRRSYYDILGIPKGASIAQIKAAYRTLARDTHPDLAPGDDAKSEAFKAAAEAYRVLSDPALRARYDADGAMPEGTAYGAPHSVVGSSLAAVARGVAKAARRAVVVPGASIRRTVPLSFGDAALGTSVVVEVMRRDREDAPLTARALSFPIPAGVRTGQVLRWQGEGCDGDPGARRGDVVLEVVVASDPRFIRDGDDIISTARVRLSALIEGVTLVVDTVHGDTPCVVPPGTQPGARLRLEGRGVAPAGAHVVHLELAMPDTLSSTQREALHAFESLLEADA